jgi:predicted acyltransferase
VAILNDDNIYKGYSRTIEIRNLNLSAVSEDIIKVQPDETANIDLKYLSLAPTKDYILEKDVSDNSLYFVKSRENATVENTATEAIQQISSATEKLPFDPEGLLGAMSAAATVIFGFLIGRLIGFYSENKEKLVMHLLLFGLITVFAGMFWGQWFIICKPLWTGSYVLYAGGLAMIILAFFIWLLDIRQYSQKYFRPFVAFGSNPLFLFVMAGVLVKTMSFAYFRIGETALQTWIYKNIYKGVIDPTFGSLMYAITFIFIMWILAEILYRKKIYIKV